MHATTFPLLLLGLVLAFTSEAANQAQGMLIHHDAESETIPETSRPLIRPLSIINPKEDQGKETLKKNLRSEVDRLLSYTNEEVRKEVLFTRLLTMETKLQQVIEENARLSVLNERYQKELSLIISMDIIEWLENTYSSGFNNTGNVLRGDNVRKAKWFFMLEHRSDERPIKYILDKIKEEDKSYNTEKIVNEIVEIEELLNKQKKIFVTEVATAASFFNKQKHKFILERTSDVPLLFDIHVPENVVRTATILEEAYVDDYLSKKVPAEHHQ